MKYLYNYKRDNEDTRDFRFSESIVPHPEVVLPKSVDLRSKCPPVYDQGKLGSCTANAGCSCRVMLLNDPGITLSRLYLYYMERHFYGDTHKDEGASLREACKSIYKAGVCEEKYMPYDPKKYKQSPNKHAFTNADNYKIIAYRSLNTLEEIKQSLAFRQQPVMIGMDVYESFESKAVAQTGIMPIPEKNEKRLGGHAVLVVGYKNTRTIYHRKSKQKETYGYLIVRNSWGESWGDKGYFYMPYSFVTPSHTYDYWIME
jgi:C1A family cysteine protease